MVKAALLAGVGAALAGLWIARTVHDPAGAEWRRAHGGLVGVNVGGWLVLERWLVGANQESVEHGPIASPFEGGPHAECEHSLTRILREKDELDRLATFREQYVTRKDFEAMRALGINAVRIPFGYWVVDESVHQSDFFAGRGLGYLDDAMRWAEELGLKVMLDLHGAPGSQSGAQTSGEQLHGWEPHRFNADAAVRTIETVAQRYASSPALVAIELLNEPELPYAALLPFYRRAYDAVRRAGCAPEKVAVVVNLYPVPNVIAHGWRLNVDMPPRRYPNLVYDAHLYYAFLPQELHKALSLARLTGLFVDVQALFLALAGRATVVGEWSLKVRRP